MDVFTHPAIPQAINRKMIDILINQVETSPLPRVRDSATRHLYSVGGTLNSIANALERDLQAGDHILNRQPDEAQNIAPETQQWLAWLGTYEHVQQQLQRISVAITGTGEAA